MEKKKRLKNYDGSMMTTDEWLARKWKNDFDELLYCEQLIKYFPPSRNTRNYQIFLAHL